MKNKILVGLTALGLAVALVPKAQAGVSFHLNLNLPLPPLPPLPRLPVLVLPPPPVIFAPPVVRCPVPVPTCRPVVVFAPGYGLQFPPHRDSGRSRGRGHGHAHDGDYGRHDW